MWSTCMDGTWCVPCVTHCLSCCGITRHKLLDRSSIYFFFSVFSLPALSFSSYWICCYEDPFFCQGFPFFIFSFVAQKKHSHTALKLWEQTVYPCKSLLEIYASAKSCIQWPVLICLRACVRARVWMTLVIAIMFYNQWLKEEMPSIHRLHFKCKGFSALSPCNVTFTQHGSVWCEMIWLHNQ